MEQSDLNALQAVIEPLETGLLSFNHLSEMVLSVDADIVSSECQTFDEIRREIEKIEKHLRESEQIADVELHRLDNQTESLTADHSNIMKKRKEQDAKLADLETCLDSYESSLKSCSEAQETEQRNLESAEQTLKEMEQNRDYATTIRNIGAGLFAIPIFGWIAGAVMVGVGQTDLNSAWELIEKARQEKEKCDAQVKVYSQKVSECKESIAKAQAEIQEVSSRIIELEAELQDLSMKRETIADVQSQTREAVHRLGLLSGVGKAAERQTRNLILVEALVKVVNQLTPVLTQIIGGDLLPSLGL